MIKQKRLTQLIAKILGIMFVCVGGIFFSSCKQNNLSCVSTEIIEVNYLMSCKDSSFPTGIHAPPIAIVQQTKTAQVFEMECNIEECECFQDEFNIVYYETRDKGLKQEISNYTVSYKGDRLNFKVYSYRPATPQEKRAYYDEDLALYIRPFLTFYSSNIVVEVNCLQCEKINATYEIKLK